MGRRSSGLALQATERKDRLGRPLGARHKTPAAAPELDIGRPTRRQGPDPDRLAGVLRGPGGCDQGPVHRVVARSGAGANGGFQQGASRGISPPGADRPAAPLRPHSRQPHAVFRQGARLVDAQKRRASEGLHHGRSAHEDVLLRQAPRAQGHEDGQHHGEFLGDQGDRQSEARQGAAQPVLARRRVDDGHHSAEYDRQEPGHADQTPRRLLQGRRRLPFLAQRLADAAHRRAGSRLHHLGDPVARHDQGSGEQPRPAVASIGARGRRAGGRRAAARRRDRLPGQQGFVHGHDQGRQEFQVRRNPFALPHQDDVPRNEVTGREALFPALAKHAGGRFRHGAQRLERPFAARFLSHGQTDRYDRAGGQEQPLRSMAEHEIEPGGRQKQEDHRLAQGAEQDGRHAPAARLANFIGSGPGETPGGLSLIEALGRERHITRRRVRSGCGRP
ncbi:hypothetical protein D3C72_722770 [compost metagenome]